MGGGAGDKIYRNTVAPVLIILQTLKNHSEIRLGNFWFSSGFRISNPKF